MTRFIHDRFAKEYLEEMLSPIGTVNISRDVTSEVREIDVYFTALELLYRLQSNLVTDIPQELESEERELIMAITPLFQQQIQAAQQQAREEGLEQGLERGLERGLEQGLEQGLERGRQEQQRLILSDFLPGKFGELSPKMSVFLTPLSKLSATEFTRMLLAISMLSVDEAGQEQAVKLLAEYVLRRYFNESADILATAVRNLLELPLVELTVLVEEMPHLSADELRARL